MKYYEEEIREIKEKPFLFWLEEPTFSLEKNEHNLVLSAIIKMRTKNFYDFSDFNLFIGNIPYDCAIEEIPETEEPPVSDNADNTENSDDAPEGNVYSAKIKVVISSDDLSLFPKNGLVTLKRKSRNSILYDGALDSYERKHSPLLFNKEKGLVGYFRQGYAGKLGFTVRVIEPDDSPRQQRLIRFAKRMAELRKKISNPRLLFLYEKVGRYEEGASVLYEYMIDQGYKNIRFIADLKNLPKSLERKYRRRIVPKYSFRCYYYYFLADTFVSSDPVSRAINLDTISFPIWQHCRRGEDVVTHVHLRHGVMYMVSLDSKTRASARKEANHGYFRGRHVVGSEKEANHFIELGGFDPTDLYITGMPKLDRAYLNPGADKILVMPTWRPWEENKAINDPDNSTYYIFIRSILEQIPEELADKTIVVPHPLFNQFLRTGAGSQDKTIDELLRDCRLLITDYSSVSYDAFYRGSNVVFDWAEKEDCMQKYGGESKIMLMEEDAFGYICYAPEELGEAIKKAYYEPQSEKFIENYRTIVKFHDNKNCSRVIECMKKDGLL